MQEDSVFKNYMKTLGGFKVERGVGELNRSIDGKRTRGPGCLFAR